MNPKVAQKIARMLKITGIILLSFLFLGLVLFGIFSVKSHIFFKEVFEEPVEKTPMKIDTYGNPSNPSLLILHGMYQDGGMMAHYGKALSDSYFVVIPTVHGMDGEQRAVFDSFDSECEYIEEFAKNNLGGKFDFAYGISMGATMIFHLLCRENVPVQKAILDGLYLANQGKFSAYMVAKNYYEFHEKAISGEDFDLGIMAFGCKMMGMSEEDAKDLFRNGLTKNHISLNNMARVALANYTYKASDDKIFETEVALWCGSKEPYALKSNTIAKPHLAHYDEVIFDGYAHGELVQKHTDECEQKIREFLR